jgi:glycosyltransferase involved in cell wall biosynthesis
MTRIPILQTCFSRSWGGLEIQALEVTDALRKRGWPVILACPGDSRLAAEAAARGIRVARFAVTGYIHPLLVLRLARLLRGEEIGIIHCQLSKDLSTVVPAVDLARTRARIILSKRVGSYLMKKDPLHRYTYSRVDRVLAVSEVIRRNVLETTPASADRVATLHDAIDTTEFSPARGDRDAVRAEFGYAPGDLVIGFAGRFSPGKGHEEFLHAAAMVSPDIPAARFLIAGEPSAGEAAYADTIVRLAETLGLRSAVTFAGFRRDVPRILSAFDIFAFPSHAESFGVVLIEAMAMERPVIASECDGILDIIVDGVSGLFIPPGNAEALGAAIRLLAADPGLRARLGRGARQRVLACFDRERQMDALEEIYCGGCRNDAAGG